MRKYYFDCLYNYDYYYTPDYDYSEMTYRDYFTDSILDAYMEYCSNRYYDYYDGCYKYA